jgi:hypothetical protein
MNKPRDRFVTAGYTRSAPCRPATPPPQLGSAPVHERPESDATLFEPGENGQFDVWDATGFGPRQRRSEAATFRAARPGAATITGLWTGTSGLQSETFEYTITVPQPR